MIKRNSILIDGVWFDGDWHVGTVDEETGELQIMVETLAEDSRHRHGLALRMDMALAAELRLMGGFVDVETLAFEPCCDCRTTEGRVSDVEKRLAALDQRVNGMALRTELQGEKNYLAERLDLELEMIQQVNKRLDFLSHQFLEAMKRVDLPLPGEDYMAQQYDAEHDAAPISYWDMKLLTMIRVVNERLGVAVGGA